MNFQNKLNELFETGREWVFVNAIKNMKYMSGGGSGRGLRVL